MAIEAPPVPGRAPGAARPRPKREREEEVLVWPDLVFVEFISAVLFTITFLLLSVFINAPLLNRANPDVTPNPSKAPWYFLNLQELLLHMDKAWAGVLLPTIALGLLRRHPLHRPQPRGAGYLVRDEVLGPHSAHHGRVRRFCERVPGRRSTLATARSSNTRRAGSPPAIIQPASMPALPALRMPKAWSHTGLITMKDISKRLEFSIPMVEIFGEPTSDGYLD